MATEVDISDHISPLKVEVEDNQRYSESSKVALKEFIKIEDMVNEGFVKVIEGENFLKSPPVADEKVEKIDEDQLNSNEKLNGSNTVDKIEINTDENIVVASNLDQKTKPVIEPTDGSLPLEEKRDDTFIETNFKEEDDSENNTVLEISFHDPEKLDIPKREGDLAEKEIVQETPEHEEHLDLEESIMHKKEMGTETESVEMLISQVSEEARTIPSVKIPDQIPAKEDEETLFPEVEQKNTPEEKTTTIVNLDEKIGVEEVAATDKSNNDSNGKSSLVDEETKMISEKPNEVPLLEIEGQVLEVLEDSKGDKIVEDEEFEEPGATDIGEIRKEKEVEEVSTPAGPENEIENGTEKSEDISRMASQTPPEEIYKEKLQKDTKDCVENADTPPTVTEVTNLPDVKPSDSQEENLDAESDPKVQDVQDIYDTTTSPVEEESCANEIEKISREVPQVLSETSVHGAESDKNDEIAYYQIVQEEETGEQHPALSSVFLSSEENGQSETKYSIEDEKVDVESSYAVSESNDQKFDEIHETAISRRAEEKEKVSENNEAETLGLESTTDARAVEEIKEIQVPDTEEIPIGKEEELFDPVPEAANKDDKIEAEDAEKTEEEHIKPEADEVKENCSKLACEPKVHSVEDAFVTQLSSTVEESVNEKESEIVPDQEISETNEECKSSDQCFEEAQEMKKKPTSVTTEEYEVREETKQAKASETTEKAEIIEKISDTEAATAEREIQADKDREEVDKRENEITDEIKTEVVKSAAEEVQEVKDPEPITQSNTTLVEEMDNPDSTAAGKAPLEEEKEETEAQALTEPVSEINSVRVGATVGDNISPNQTLSIESKELITGPCTTLVMQVHENVNEEREEVDKIENEITNDINTEVVKSIAEVVQEAKVVEPPTRSRSVWVEETDDLDLTAAVGKTPIEAEIQELDTVPESVSEISTEKVGAILGDDMSADSNEITVEPITEEEKVKAESVNKNDILSKEDTAGSLETSTMENVVLSELDISNSEVTAHDNKKRISEEELDEENEEEKIKCDEATGLQVTTETEVSLLGESKVSEGPIKTVDTSKQDSEVNSLKLEEVTSVEFQLPACENDKEACESRIADKNEIENAEGKDLEVPGPEPESLGHNDEAVIDEETYELSTGECEEHQEPSSLLSEKQDETEKCFVSETNTESNVLSVEEVHESETTAAEEKTHENKEEQKTTEALETILESNSQVVGEIIDKEIHSSQTFPLESVESAKDGVEGTDITPTTASEVTNSEEIKLNDKAVDSFDMSSDSNTIRLEEACTIESLLPASDNDAEARKSTAEEKNDMENVEGKNSEVSEPESESLVHNVKAVIDDEANERPLSSGECEEHQEPSSTLSKEDETQESFVSETKTESNVLGVEEATKNETTAAEEKTHENKEEEKTTEALETTPESNGHDVGEIVDLEIHSSHGFPLESVEGEKDGVKETDITPTTAREVTNSEEIKFNDNVVESFDMSSDYNAIKLEEVSSVESQFPAIKNDAEACKSTTEEKNDMEKVEGKESEIPGPESESLIQNAEAVIKDEADEQPLSSGECEEHQEQSSMLSKEDETQESFVSETKTESNVLGVEEVHETETAAAEEKTHENKEEEKTMEALETTPEFNSQEIGEIVVQEIHSSQGFPLESLEGAKDGVEETDTTPTTACTVTNSEEIKLNANAVVNFDTGSDSKTSETIEAVDACKQDSEVENIKPEEASMEESKVAEAKTEADDIEVENQKVFGAEAESLKVEEIIEANASPREAGTTVSEEAVQELPKPLPEGINQSPETDGTIEILPTPTSQTENIKEEVHNLSSDFLSSEESQENKISTINPREDDGSKLQETSGMLSRGQNTETGEASFSDEVIAEEVKSSDASCQSKNCLEEIHEAETTPPSEISEVNIEEKTGSHEGTAIAVTSGTEVTILGESKLMNEPIDTFGTSSETTTQEIIKPVDTPEHVSEVDDIKLEEASSMESQLLADKNEKEVESSEVRATDSESSMHIVEDIHEKVLTEVPEVINQDVNVLIAEEGTEFDVVCEPREHLEEIHETKASPNEEISGVDKREKEIESVVEKVPAPTNPDVEAVIGEIDEQPLPTGGLEEHQDSSSAVLSKLDDTKESEVSETKTESNAFETTAVVETSHANKLEEETKEALETMSELECQDVEAITDPEILSTKSFPLERIEDAKDGVEEADTALKTASDVTSIGDIKLSDEVVREAHIGFESTTSETIETANTCSQDSEVEINKPEEASIKVPELAEHDNEIEARENATAIKAGLDYTEIENQKVRVEEAECSSVEEIREENASPAVGEIDTNISEEVIRELMINQDPEAEKAKEELQNSSSVLLPSEESNEDETATAVHTEDDNCKLLETSGILPQLQTVETQVTSNADNVKAEVEKGFDVVCESKHHVEEIHETNPTAKISTETKMEDETNIVAEKKSNIQAIVDDIPVAESTGMSIYPTERADADAGIQLLGSNEAGEAIVLESITSPRVLHVEEIHGTETSPTVRQTRTDGEEDDTKKVHEIESKPGYEDVAEIIDQNSTQDIREEIKSDEGTDIGPAAVIEEKSLGKINPSDEVPEAFDISSDTKTQEAILVDDTTVQDLETNKSQLQESQNIPEIHERNTSTTVGEVDANVSAGGLFVEEPKSYCSVAEPKDQGVQDIPETGSISSIREAEMREIDQEAREAPETIDKEMNQDAIVVSKDEISPNQPIKAEKIQEQEEKGFDPVPEPKDQNFLESLECKFIPVKESEGYNTKSKLEIHGSEKNHVQKVADTVGEQLDEAAENLREGESEAHIENTTEAAQARHETTSIELLTTEAQKAEANNTLGETITSHNSNAEIPEQAPAVTGTANVTYAAEEKDEKCIDKEPRAENDGNEYVDLATETRSTEEVKSPELVLENNENNLGDYNNDKAAMSIINNNEKHDEKNKMEQEAKSDFSLTKIPEEELADEGEIPVDEKERDLNLDPVSIMPSVEEQSEKLENLPRAINQETVIDVTETNEILKKSQDQEKISLSLSQDQVARKEYTTKESETMNATANRDFQVISAESSATKQVELREEGKLGEKSPESIEKLTLNDLAEVSSSEILLKPSEETNQATQEPNPEPKEKALAEKENIDGEEEGDQNKADSGSDAPVVVEASREMDVKTPQKKSHGILSGVGSKVKHSISKVKKAITGKSSHQKASSPKEVKKTEAIPLL